MLGQIKKQLQQCCRYISRMVRIKGSFEVGFLNRVCDLLLCEQVLSMDINMQNNTNNNINKHSSNRIDFAQLINQLLYLPPSTSQQKPTQSYKQQKQQLQQYILLLIVDSLIFNLYGRSKKMDKLRLNNSFFNSSVSMSMSQMSDQWSQHNYSVINNNNQNDLLKLALIYIECLVNSDIFYKRLKVYYDRQTNKHKNHHYLQNLLQTLQYILNKQKLPIKQHFIKQRNIYFKTFLQSSTPVTFIPNQTSLQTINCIIFNDQLDKIITLISTAQSNGNIQQLLFSLNRVYFVGRKAQTRKHFRSIKFSAQDIFYNLSKIYIQSFSSKLSILQQSRHPIFMLLKSYLFVFHLPVFKTFTDLVVQVTKYYHSNVMVFYQQNQQILDKLMNQFIDQLPLELIQYLSMLHKLIQNQFIHQSVLNSPIMSRMSSQQISKTQTINQSNQQIQLQQRVSNNVSSLIPIKRFLIYSFLCQPQLIKQFVFTNSSSSQSVNSSNTNTNNNSNIIKNNNKPTPLPSLQHYQQVCNYLINLFFSSSIKKYTNNFTLQQLSPLTKLSQSIQRKLQQKILTFNKQPNDFCYYDQQYPSMLDNYFIQQPILNYDYQILSNVINIVEFTPKDNKKYQILTYSISNNNNNNININTNNNLTDKNNNNLTDKNKSNQFLTNVNNNYNIRLLDDQPNQHKFKNTLYNKQTDIFLKNNQFIRHNKRQLTLSPNKFTFIQQKQSLNATLTGQSFFIRGPPHLTTPMFYNQQQQQHNQNDNQVDLLTWMTIGGSHNYKQKVSARKIKLSKTLNLQNKTSLNQQYQTNKIDQNQNQSQKYYNRNSPKKFRNSPANIRKQQFKQQDQREYVRQEMKQPIKKRRQFKTLNKQKVKQINRLYEQYASKNIYV